MKLPELVRTYERRAAEAKAVGSTAPVARVYEAVLEDLKRVDGVGTADRMMRTDEAADVLGIAPKTAARWCRDGRLPGARKTSEDGRWRVPARNVYEAAGRPRSPGRGKLDAPPLLATEEG